MPVGKTLAMILAGGEGRRLEPLTRERAKPAVPFGGRYRIIDFVLSNFANSGVLRMKVLTQYKSDSLNNHLSRAWRMSALLGQFVESVPAQMRTGPDWYKGCADAIYQNLNLITDEEPDHVFVFGADHIYRMDVRQMLDFHLAQKADCTVAAIPVPIEEARRSASSPPTSTGGWWTSWRSRRTRRRCPAIPTMCLASMGNYLFATEALVREIVRDAAQGQRARLRQVDHQRDAQARGVRVRLRHEQGARAGAETERGYWRDVGDHRRLLPVQHGPGGRRPDASTSTTTAGPSTPRRAHCPPAKFVFADEENEPRRATPPTRWSREGCIISGGRVHRSRPLAATCASTPTPRWRSRILFENVAGRPALRASGAPSSTRTSRSPPGTDRSATTPRRTASGSSSARRGSSVIPKGMRLAG